MLYFLFNDFKFLTILFAPSTVIANELVPLAAFFAVFQFDIALLGIPSFTFPFLKNLFRFYIILMLHIYAFLYLRNLLL